MKKRVRVTLYTKPGCHLCQEAKEQIIAARCQDLYVLDEVNIEEDPALYDRYRYEIPVIAINGQDTFRFSITPVEFIAALHASLKEDLSSD